MKEILRLIETWLMAAAVVIFCETHSNLFILPMAVATAICLAIAISEEGVD